MFRRVFRQDWLKGSSFCQVLEKLANSFAFDAFCLILHHQPNRSYHERLQNLQMAFESLGIDHGDVHHASLLWIALLAAGDA